MSFYVSVQPALAVVSGLVILGIPRLLNYVVALYLIIAGLMGLFGPRGA